MAAVFSIPFANSGDKVQIPSAVQSDGKVSFEEGFGKDYEKALLTNSDAKNIERKKLNYLFNLFCVKMNTLGLSIDDLAAKLTDLTLPIGVPFPYPLATPPDSKHLKCNGGSFDTSVYTKLATMYPSGVLPDLRGVFIRGWDDGKGIDTGRNLLSLQLDSIQDHGHKAIRLRFIGGGSGGWAVPDASMDFTGDNNLVNGVSPTGFNGGSPRVSGETRPRNIAFNYIMRAI